MTPLNDSAADGYLQWLVMANFIQMKNNNPETIRKKLNAFDHFCAFAASLGKSPFQCTPQDVKVYLTYWALNSGQFLAGSWRLVCPQSAQGKISYLATELDRFPLTPSPWDATACTGVLLSSILWVPQLAVKEAYLPLLAPPPHLCFSYPGVLTRRGTRPPSYFELLRSIHLTFYHPQLTWPRLQATPFAPLSSMSGTAGTDGSSSSLVTAPNLLYRGQRPTWRLSYLPWTPALLPRKG